MKLPKLHLLTTTPEQDNAKTAQLKEAFMTDEELAQRMKMRDAQMHADLCFDRETEARTYPSTPNPHDD